MHSIRADTDRNSQRIGVAVAVSLHLAVFAALLSYAPVREAMLAAAPIMVSYIVPVENPPEPPKPLPVRPPQKAAPPRPIEPAPVLAITADAPAPFETPIPEAKPLPPIQEAPTQPSPALPTIPPNFGAAYLDNPPPAYPALSKRNGEQGKVLLRVLVTSGGAAEKVELHTSSRWQRLDQVALDTVKRWRFVPARQGDNPVAAWVLVPITFTLEN